MVPRALGPLIAVALWLAACGGAGDGAAHRSQAPRADTTIQPSGVYTYATRGFERLSAVFASRHDYPRVSRVDVQRGGCGFSERWQPRPERWSEWRYCIAGSRWRLETLLDYHEFFGQAVRQRFACQGRFVPRPTKVPVGFRWTDRCRGAGSRVTVRYRALRDETVSAGGKRVKTVLVRAQAQLRGQIAGVNVIDSWLSRANGLLVRRAVTSATAIGSPFGKLRDSERYALTIRSLKPQ
jgi:hypothetical protein